MPASRKVRFKSFDGDHDFYSVVEVKVQIRILGPAISRSRLAVNIYPDPGLRELAQAGLKDNQFGENAEGEFVVCLAESFNGWEDMNDTYPVIEQHVRDAFRKDDAKRMNHYIKRSVEWSLKLHREAERGNRSVGRSPAGNPERGS